jgi:hypothetical protein
MLNGMYDDYVARYGEKNTPRTLFINTARSGLRQSDSLSIIKMDTLFTKEDLDYIFKQAKDTTAIVLRRALLKGSVTLFTQEERDKFWQECASKDIDSCWSAFDRRYGPDGYTKYNKPLFNKNHTVALLYFEHHCGSLCGNRGTYILRKEKSGWKVLKLINPGIS